jgi:alpha-galactosidase
MLADYYPMTPYTLATDQWIAWQFNRPEQGDGVVQAFRRADCPERTLTLRLRGLDPIATYAVTDLDAVDASHVRGAVLMEQGLKVELPIRPGVAVLLYEKTQEEA